MSMQSFKETLLYVIQEAGAYVKSRFQTNFDISSKTSINNLVTEVDQASERLIKDLILSKYPDHQFLGEEYGSEISSSEYLWVVDPIDGTLNFAYGIPMFCVSIALLHQNTILLGAVFNPITNELFFAEKGKGAFLNEQPIQVSKNSDLNTAFLVTGFPYEIDDLGDGPLNIFNEVVKRNLPVRRLGSAAMDLCYVAAGRFDAFWEYKLQPWDIAAGYLILSEAGGKISTFDQKDSYTIWDKQTLATNGVLHESMFQFINQYI